MPITTINPHGDDSPVAVGEPVYVKALVTAPETSANMELAVSINGGAYSVFQTGRDDGVWVVGTAVSNADGSGNKGADVATIRARDTSTGVLDTTTAIIVASVPKVNCSVPGGELTTRIRERNFQPIDVMKPGGLADPSEPTGADLLDPEDVTPNSEDCSSIPKVPSSDEGCDCGPASMSTVATSGFGIGMGVAKPGDMICNLPTVAYGSQISAALYGRLQVKTECATLPTRGERLELCSFFLDAPDGLISSERIAGKKRTFGWQVRLIEDTVGNVAIYWGDRRIEGWKKSGSNYLAPRGTFGTLTKQADNSFTRTTKNSVYFDFNSAGRLQTIKDRSQDGNILYYNYNGSNQMVRITGPGLGFVPYFTYDANGRVNTMSLEWAADSAKNRVT
jgi:hypothetical protein